METILILYNAQLSFILTGRTVLRDAIAFNFHSENGCEFCVSGDTRLRVKRVFKYYSGCQNKTM